MSQIVFRKNVTVGAGTKVDNQVQGSDIEFLDGPWLLTLFATEDTGDGVLTLRNGSRQTIASEALPNVNTNAVVNTQQDMLAQSVLVQNAHVILSLDNSAGSGDTEFRILLVAEQVPS
jgi:hypothetical protein